MAPSRRLEDRIRQLCIRVGEASDGNMEPAIDELQAALSEDAMRVHNKTSATVLAWPELSRDRRRA